jgi:hypothetical protein
MAFIVVVVATSYGLNDGGAGVPVPLGENIFTSPYRPDMVVVT